MKEVLNYKGFIGSIHFISLQMVICFDEHTGNCEAENIASEIPEALNQTVSDWKRSFSIG